MGHTLGMSDTLAIQAFLAPLKRLAARHPGIEGQVLWEGLGTKSFRLKDLVKKLG